MRFSHLLGACVLVLAGLVTGNELYGVEGRTETARTWVFMCPDESSYVVRATETEAWVFRAGSTLRLHVVPDAMPLRYGQGDVQLVIEGDSGMLSEPGKETFTCRNHHRRAVWEHAKLDGVDFRGVGNEPPWVLEMREMSRIVLITEYGANRIERPLPKPINDNARKMTRWDAGNLQIEITAEICHDTMSGEEFSSRVVIYWQGKVLRGCGRPLH
ncbi:hypothetical protein [Petrachloros mirabilis]